MIKKLSSSLLLLLALVCFTSCKDLPWGSHEGLVAECYGQSLYKSDLEGLIIPGTSANDSIELTRQFIETWVRQQILLKQAESNLTEEKKNFTDQLESYRNSLTIYAYESELIKQKLDTAISEAQFDEFYNSNQGNLLLNENIVRVNFVKIPVDFDNNVMVKRIQKLIKSSDEKDIEELVEAFNNAGLVNHLDQGDWISFDKLTDEIPINTSNQEEFLNSGSFHEIKDSTFTYMVYFRDFKTKATVSPLSYEINNIRNIILNRRKVELVDRMQQEVFQEALKNKEFTIY